MRAVVQRVSSASVTVAGEQLASIGAGLLILLGVTHGDGAAEVDYLAAKCAGLRIFRDSEDKMNLSVAEIGGEVIVVSPITLYADCRKGKRPAFVVLYEQFVERLRQAGLRVGTGRFGADMQVSLCNDGPVTILLDTREMMNRTGGGAK